MIDKVNSFAAVLKDPKASKDQRAEALMKIDGPSLIEEENQPGIATLVAVPLGAMQYRPADSQGLTWLKLSVSCVRSPMNRIFLRVLSILAMLPWMVHAARAGSNAQSNGPPDVPAYKKNKDGTPEQQFMKRHEGFVEQARKGGVDLLLVGDFLTDDWRGNNKNTVRAIYEKSFGPYHPANFGQGGDYTQHVLWRLQNGELEGVKPKVVMLLIGGTNGSNGDDPAKIAAGVRAIIDTIETKAPGAKVLLIGVPPWQERSGKLRERETAVNPLLAAMDDGGKTIKYVDFGPKLIGPDGTVPKELMPDGVHLSDKGYQLWADAVAAPLKELMMPTPPEETNR